MVQRVVYDQGDLRVGAAGLAFVPGDPGQLPGAPDTDQGEPPFLGDAGEPLDLGRAQRGLEAEVTPVDAVFRQPCVHPGEPLPVGEPDGTDQDPLAVTELEFVNDRGSHENTIGVRAAEGQGRSRRAEHGTAISRRPQLGLSLNGTNRGLARERCQTEPERHEVVDDSGAPLRWLASESMSSRWMLQPSGRLSAGS